MPEPTRPLSTEARAFARQLTANLAAREQSGAALLSPGCKTWGEAFRMFAKTVAHTSRGPIGAADTFMAGLERLKQAHRNGECFVNCYARRRRSGSCEVLTYEPGLHPLIGEGERGVIVRGHAVILSRQGRINFGSSKLSFISWHTLGRIFERAERDVFQHREGVPAVIAATGFAAMLMREDERHHNQSVSYADDTLTLSGVLRFARDEQGFQHGFVDFLTCLPVDACKGYQLRQRKQGIAVAHMVYCYVKSDNADPRGYAEHVDVVPFDHSDFVSRQLNKGNI
jgi:hypothetical protein